MHFFPNIFPAHKLLAAAAAAPVLLRLTVLAAASLLLDGWLAAVSCCFRHTLYHIPSINEARRHESRNAEYGI